MTDLRDYLVQAYRRDILNESVVIEMPTPDPKLIAKVKAELAYINGLGLGANLVNRNFVLAQNKQALEKLLAQLQAAQQLQAKQAQQSQQEAVPPSEG